MIEDLVTALALLGCSFMFGIGLSILLDTPKYRNKRSIFGVATYGLAVAALVMQLL